MTEQQKEYIKNAIERANQAWNEIQNTITYLQEAQGGRPADSYEWQELQQLVTEFASEQHNLELRIEALERLVKG